MGTELGRVEITTPDGAYAHCRSLAATAVAYARLDAGTKEAAVDSISRRYGFGSWFAKLHKGHKVTLHLHFYERLCRAVEDAVKRVEERAARDRQLAEAIRGRHAAFERSAGPGEGLAPVGFGEGELGSRPYP